MTTIVIQDIICSKCSHLFFINVMNSFSTIAPPPKDMDFSTCCPNCGHDYAADEEAEEINY